MVKDYKIEITEVRPYSHSGYNGMYIDWTSAIGWGETSFFFEPDGSIEVDTENVCSNDEKEFLYQLMKAFVDKCEVTG
ncbi:MAG: hypothetical protein IJI45_16550 [Anaerolineaceae bacterium]|nr:hypothetical protein [Anaerolineaceae bacterium]